MATMIAFHVPEDPALLSAFGEVSLRHEHLNYVLRMTIKTLAELKPQEAIDATALDSSSVLRERVRRLGKQRLGEGQALLKLQALVERCRVLTNKRNDYVHSVWVQELDGLALRRNAAEGWVPLPTTNELSALGQELLALTNELNIARLEGFLFKALAERRGRDA